FGEGANTSIKFKYENGNVDANRPRITPPRDSVSPWFRSDVVSDSNPFGGLNQQTVSDPYDAFANYLNASGDNYNPWFSGGGLNAQQPFWLIDASTGAVPDARAGPSNNGARTPAGPVRRRSAGLARRLHPATV